LYDVKYHRIETEMKVLYLNKSYISYHVAIFCRNNRFWDS